MGKIYKAQTKLRIQRTVSQDISGATALKIKYIKPDGTTGEWTATVGTAATGVIYYDVSSSSTLNLSGDWVTWAYVTFADARSAAGEPVMMRVYEEGS
jgi:hypothetical protein